MSFKFTWRIWLLTIFLVLSLLSIFNFSSFFQQGLVITSVEPNSSSFDQGFRENQIITEIDGKNIESVSDFSSALEGKFILNKTISITFTMKNSEINFFSNTAPEITISEIPKTNIKFGLDLIGGSRALVKAENIDLSSSEIRDLVDTTANRLNEFGLTDLKVRAVSDLEGNNFMLVEIAGATPKDLRDLISQQGKFEAKIGNQTVFIGGKDKDITSVCRGDPTCAGIEQCSPAQPGYVCNFRFQIYLSEEAAKRHSAITKNLSVNSTPQGRYLSEPLDLYLDDSLVESLLISEGLKGIVTTQIVISGSGSGETNDLALKSAEDDMHKLQTILITGSLPYKLEIVKLDTISPILGKDFIKSIMLAGLASFLAISIMIFLRYRRIKSSFLLIFTSMSEVIIILGIAALIGWNLDLLSIAGILATIGTGVDQQIIVLDEAKQSNTLSLKQKMKRAFAIILGAYSTAVVSLFPLLWAGAGLLKGFVFTTLIGITAGVLITRPAFTDMVERMEED